MAKVAVIMRVFPEDIDVNLENLVKEIEERLPEGYSVKAWDEEPIAFGLKALRLIITMPEESEGGTEPLEELISQIPRVSQVEVLMVHRVLE